MFTARNSEWAKGWRTRTETSAQQAPRKRFPVFRNAKRGRIPPCLGSTSYKIGILVGIANSLETIFFVGVTETNLGLEMVSNLLIQRILTIIAYRILAP